MILSFLLLLFFQPSPITSQDLVPKNTINVFLLAGQSNMAGRGGVTGDNTVTNNATWDGVVPPQCQPNPSILRLSSDLVWVQAHEPLHADIDVRKTNGIGPGMSFANAVLTRDPGFGLVGLVPCAIGGTNISEWEKGGFLYEQLVRRAQAAQRSGGVYRAVLWYQGESDTEINEDAELYGSRLIRFFTDLRSDLQDPILPIIQVALASGGGPYVDIVRRAQLGAKLVNMQCVDAKGLPLEPDGLHLTTPAQVRIGETMAAAFRQTQSSLPTTTTTPIHTISSSPTFNFKFSSNYYYFLIISLSNVFHGFI